MGGTATGRAVMLLAATLALLAACGRNQYPLTACEGGRPVIERTLDVAPPNC